MVSAKKRNLKSNGGTHRIRLPKQCGIPVVGVSFSVSTQIKIVIPHRSYETSGCILQKWLEITVFRLASVANLDAIYFKEFFRSFVTVFMFSSSFLRKKRR
ncbi:MAG: hypothetical protein J1E00_09235 [Oscillospiraceae bacterium]|nr:hypothetical protein [Oscillospiraceae bacterium]